MKNFGDYTYVVAIYCPVLSIRYGGNTGVNFASTVKLGGLIMCTTNTTSAADLDFADFDNSNVAYSMT